MKLGGVLVAILALAFAGRLLAGCNLAGCADADCSPLPFDAGPGPG